MYLSTPSMPECLQRPEEDVRSPGTKVNSVLQHPDTAREDWDTTREDWGTPRKDWDTPQGRLGAQTSALLYPSLLGVQWLLDTAKEEAKNGPTPPHSLLLCPL